MACGHWFNAKRRARRLVDLLAAERIVMHPFVRGEIALSSLADRARTLAVLDDLPHLKVAAVEHVTTLIDSACLWNSGIGYIDAHLLTTARLVQGTRPWTRDKRPHAQAEKLNIAYPG